MNEFYEFKHFELFLSPFCFFHLLSSQVKQFLHSETLKHTRAWTLVDCSLHASHHTEKRHCLCNTEMCFISLPFHCSPWQMQCGLCHHADHSGASYVPPHLPQPSQSGSLQAERHVSQFIQMLT